MVRYVCKKRCFYNRLWEEGEILEPKDGEKVPEYFEPVTALEPYKEVKDQPVPRTLKELQDEERAAEFFGG